MWQLNKSLRRKVFYTSADSLALKLKFIFVDLVAFLLNTEIKFSSGKAQNTALYMNLA